MDENQTKHPAFGLISASHVSGNADLFMVDYPQQHFITLKISTAILGRSNSNDWLYEDKRLIEITMSEVQWARMIASPNTQGVPCTLTDYREPLTGKWITPKMPEHHVAKRQTFSNEIDATAKKTATQLADALKEVERLMGGGPVKKADLAKVKDLLYHAHMNLAENLSFVVQQAEESIGTAVESAKAEVDAHIDFSMQKLGERALGDRLQAAIDAGADVRAIGQNIAKAVTHQKVTPS